MVRLISLFALAACFLVGCAAHTTPSSATADVADVISAESDALPTAYGPLTRHQRGVRIAEEMTAKVTSLRGGNQFIGPELLAAATKTRYLVFELVTNDPVQLKHCVAADLAPLVVLRSPVGPKHLRALVGYDDVSARFYLMVPDSSRTRLELSYEDFQQQWDAGGNVSLLIYPTFITVDALKRILSKHTYKGHPPTIHLRKL